MNWKDIINETGIEIIWAENDYSQEGSFVPPCSAFPNGAIAIRINVPEERVEFVALHEIGHIVTGKMLNSVNERLKSITHLKNEADANRFLLRNKASDFLEANDFNGSWATAERFCNYLGLSNTFENIWIAEQEINYALYNIQ